MSRILVALALIAGLAATEVGGPRAEAFAPCAGTARPAHYTHVVWVIFENRSLTQVKGHARYIDGLAAACGYASHYFATDHPSLPNYLELTSGKPSSQLPHTDCPTFCAIHGPSIFAQNPSWGVFAESMLAYCQRIDSGPYRAHHTAAPYYVDLTNCRTNDVPLTRLNPAALPRFSLVIPNVANDMHQGSSTVAAGDRWLAVHLPPILASVEYAAGHTAVFVTFDEGGIRSSNNVLTLALARPIRPGTVSTGPFTHYSLLRTTEEMLGYPLLGLAGSAASMRAGLGL